MDENKFQKLFYFEGALSFANITLLTGAFMIAFALEIGANNFQIGLISAIPLFANLIQIISAFILDKTGTRKWTAVISLFIGRSVWIFVVLIAFGIFDFKNKILVLMIVLIISSLFNSVGNLALLSWMKVLVNFRQLARFWGKRNIFASVSGILLYVAGSFIIDRYVGLTIFGYIFLFALFIGIVGLVLILLIPEKKTKIKAINSKKFFRRMKMPLIDKNFRPFLIFGIMQGFAFNLASPFFVVFMLKELNLSFFMISIFLVIDTIGRIYGLNLWRKIIDKYGAKPVITITLTISSFVPLMFVFILKSYYYLIPIIFIISSVSYAGLDIALGQAMFRSAPRKYNAYYISTFSSLNGISSALGPIIGGLIAMYISTNHIDLFSPLKWVFIISFVIRISLLNLSKNIHEPAAKEVDDIIDRLKTLRFASFLVNIYSIANYSSKMVLVPQKQLFILQRKAAHRLKKDISSTVTLMGQISESLGKITVNNIKKYQETITQFQISLSENIKNMFYVKGTNFEYIPKNVLSKMNSLSKTIETKSSSVAVKEAKKTGEIIENFEDKLDKEYIDGL